MNKVRTEIKTNSPCRSIVVCEQNNFIACGHSSGVLSIYDYNNDSDIKLNAQHNAHRSYITKISLNNERNLLATASADTEIKIWDKSDLGKEFKFRNKFVGHSLWVWDCCFSVDSAYLVSCSTDKTIRLWSLSENKQVSNLSCSKGVTKIVICDECKKKKI